MTKTKSLLILIFTLLFSNYYLSSFPEEISITTYYPSPVGIYKELRAKRMAIGDSFYNSSHYCWEGSCTVSVDSDADLVVEGKVGIGTTDPEKELHVAGDAEIEGGVVIGNPTGGNKGTGTINAKKIYVNGSEIGGGGFSECEIVEKECCRCGTTGGWIHSCDVSCPSDKWLISGGGRCGYVWGGARYDGMYESYPKTAGKGGTWHVRGLGAYTKEGGCSCMKVYALCCK